MRKEDKSPMSTHPKQFPIPKKRELLKAERTRTGLAEWERYIQTCLRGERKIAQKRGVRLAELEEPWLGRRKQAILETLPTAEARSADREGLAPNAPGEDWVQLCMASGSLLASTLQEQSICAAAIWVLDHVELADLYPHLPPEDALGEEDFRVSLWDPQYAEELIASLCHVLMYRNGKPEPDGTGQALLLRDRASAAGVYPDCPERRAFEAVCALLPPEAVARETAALESLLWQSVDRYSARMLPLHRDLERKRREYNEQCTEYNAVCDKIAALVAEAKDAARQRRSGRAPAASPLLPVLQNPEPVSDALDSSVQLMDRLAGRLRALFLDLERLEDSQNALLEEMESLYQNRQEVWLKTALGELRDEEEAPLPVEDPYGLCFALLYLTDAGSPLPWLYGPVDGLMQTVLEHLPWGVVEFELEPGLEEEPLPMPDPAPVLPDWNARRYRKEGDNFPRSLAQLLYEETGCLLPRTMDRYLPRAGALAEYGVSGPELAQLLTLMGALGAARRQQRLWEPKAEDAPEPEAETAAESDTADKAEIKRLRTALYEADKAARDARKALEDSRTQAAREHRELADLRELIFNRENAQEQEEESPEEAEDGFPYQVQHSTLVFGGHETWSNAIRRRLQGSVRFIEKDFKFDTSIIRRADVLWVQPNALAHKAYYRIIDTARQYKKPVRYFTKASAYQCAVQLRDFDREK